MLGPTKNIIISSLLLYRELKYTLCWEQKKNITLMKILFCRLLLNRGLTQRAARARGEPRSPASKLSPNPFLLQKIVN